MPKPDVAAPLPKPTWLGRTLPSGLRVVASLGETVDGAFFSAVYPTGLEVALLVPRYSRDQATDSVVLERVRERILKAIEIKHTNVAGVYATGETTDGSLYIVLERLIGEPLSAILAARGTLPLAEALNLCLQACAGLQAAHALGIVHGNLSPNGLLVGRAADGRPVLKIIGFRLDPSHPPQEPGPPGRPDTSAQYASPERLAGQVADERADVFSLGAVLNHMIAGLPPTLGEVADSLPPNVRPVLTMALAEIPLYRFQSMAELAAAIEPIEQALSRAGNTWTRRPLMRGAAAVSLAATLGLGVWVARHRPIASGPTPISLEAGEAAGVDRDSAVSAPATIQVAPSPPPPPPVRARDTSSAARPAPAAAAAPAPPPVAIVEDSLNGPKVSPFRQSHPWAAAPGGRYYYRSSCPEALRLPDLVFFKSESEARENGFVPTPIPGCN